MKVLWLASLYPSRIHPFDGDFVQRHAQAVALFCEVEVIHVVKDDTGLVTSDVKETIFTHGQLTERIIYYRPVKTFLNIVDRLLSSLKFKKIFRDAVKQYISINGKPSFFHLHIALKAGLTALWLKRKYKIPYILTEHWGGYLPEAVPNIRDYNAIYHHYWNRIIKGAGAGTFVSAALQKIIIENYAIKNTLVIPNVVNTGIFFPVKNVPDDKLRLIHISTMIYQKNPEAILKALSLLKDEFAFEALFYGPVIPSLVSLRSELQLQDHVLLKGEVPQEELSKSIQRSDALILYSRFETFGCVLIEANACGVPVIVSDLPVFHEIVEEDINGVFVKGEDPVALAEKLKQFVKEKNSFNKNAIAAKTAEKYNYEKVGKQFYDLYTKMLANTM